MLCPFCAEEIKDAARKCKHFGEWLKNQSETKVTVKPKDESFEVLNNFKMYNQFFEYKNVKHHYHEIKHFQLIIMSQSANFVASNYCLIAIWKDESSKPLSISKKSIIVKTNEFDNFIKAGQILSKITFDQRMGEYLKQISNQGFISYPPIKKLMGVNQFKFSLTVTLKMEKGMVRGLTPKPMAINTSVNLG